MQVITSIHDLERALVTLLNFQGWSLKWCGGGFEHYDASGKTPKGFDCVIEMKFRNKYYETKMIEKYKYDKLMEMDSSILKLYLVCDPKENTIFNLGSLKLNDSQGIPCPSTTLWDNDKRNKEVYLLDPNLGYTI